MSSFSEAESRSETNFKREIAAHVPVKAPKRVASLTLIGPTLDPHAFAVTTQTLRLLHDALNEPFRLWLNWAFDFCRAGIRRAIGTTREMFKDRIENQLPFVRHPTLIIRGGKDPTVPQRAAEEMVRLLPGGKLLVINGEPHCVHYTQPELICRIVEQHTQNASRSSGLQSLPTNPVLALSLAVDGVFVILATSVNRWAMFFRT